MENNIVQQALEIFPVNADMSSNEMWWLAVTLCQTDL